MLDYELLEEIGLGNLPPEHANAMLLFLRFRLELAVGAQIADAFTEEQFDEFEAIFRARDDEAGHTWLEHNVPNYRSVVHSVYDTLRRQWIDEGPDVLVEELRVHVRRQFTDRVERQIYAQLSAEQRRELDWLRKGADAGEVVSWLDRNVPDHGAIAAAEIEAFWSEVAACASDPGRSQPSGRSTS